MVNEQFLEPALPKQGILIWNGLQGFCTLVKIWKKKRGCVALLGRVHFSGGSGVDGVGPVPTKRFDERWVSAPRGLVCFPDTERGGNRHWDRPQGIYLHEQISVAKLMIENLETDKSEFYRSSLNAILRLA